MTLRAGERDTLGTAVLASIVLHVVLLNALPGWRDWQRSPEPAPILARITPEQFPAESGAELLPNPEALLQPTSPPIARPLPARRFEPPREEMSTSEAPPPAAPAADAGTIAQYRLAIISLAKGFNRYPRIAVENNWRGRVEVHLSVGADGTIASLGLRSGSGHEILDRQALDMIGQAARQVALPAALRGREFVIDIPVIFSLTQAER